MDKTALVFFAKVCQLFYRGNVYEVSLFMVCFHNNRGTDKAEQLITTSGQIALNNSFYGRFIPYINFNETILLCIL